MSDEQEGALERRFLGLVEVDSGTLLIGDPGYFLPRAEEGHAGVDYQAVVGAGAGEVAVPFANDMALLIQDFGGDGTFPVYGEFEGGELVRVCVDLIPLGEEEDDEG